MTFTGFSQVCQKVIFYLIYFHRTQDFWGGGGRRENPFPTQVSGELCSFQRPLPSGYLALIRDTKGGLPLAHRRPGKLHHGDSLLAGPADFWFPAIADLLAAGTRVIDNWKQQPGSSGADTQLKSEELQCGFLCTRRSNGGGINWKPVLIPALLRNWWQYRQGLRSSQKRKAGR